MTRIGMLTPSSNTVLEPVTYEILCDLPGVTAHFSRFRVTEIGLGQAALGQFDTGPILDAAELLSHAKCDVIIWNGTSASWLGFDRDEALIAQIEARTGIRAATCVLGYRALLRRHGVRRVGLVTPYTPDVQARIVAVWGAAGFAVTAERHTGLSDNFSFASVAEDAIARMVRDVAAEGCDAVAILCTNMCGAKVAARLEGEIGIPVFDSVAVGLWSALQAVGVPRNGMARWGRAYTG
jgi:maleate isomerase